MFAPKVLSVLKNSNIGHLPKALVCMNARHSVGNLDGKRFYSSDTTPKDICSGFMDTTMYDIMPTAKAAVDPLKRNFMIKEDEITPDMLFSNEKREQFMSYFPEIVQQLEERASTLDDIENGRHVREFLEYIIPGGTKYAGIVTVETYKMLLPKEQHTPENIKLGYYLGWCVEFLVEHVVLIDDLMDEGTIRRNKRCWYLLEKNHNGAPNDGCILESGMYYFLRKNLGHLKCFPQLVQYLCEAGYSCYYGQYIDKKYSNDPFNTSPKLYKTIVQNASTYIVSYVPVLLAMTLAGYTDIEKFNNAKSIMSQLGFYYLIENDYMDIFSDISLKKKDGRDAQTGRTRWPIVVFMERANQEQKLRMKEHYGKDTVEDVAEVKKLMEEIHIHDIYHDYMAGLYYKLMQDIEENSYGELKEVYLKLINTMTCSLDAGGVFP
ncbi:farnesyl pyrophosphate synthase-like [Lutzomyia longipalpis]|nr:farnesyl pyrophosphate synthase-like [Lutzomyia longipalpis]